MAPPVRSSPPPGHEDSFRRHLGWSVTLHLVALGAVAIGVGLNRGPDLLPASAAFIELGMSGPSPTPNLGGGAPVPPAPEPPPEEPEPEAPEEPPAEEPPPPPPPEERPEVVRPTVENRDRMPVPDARERSRALRPERPESGLRGRDAASAESAPLARASEPSSRIDTKSRPTRPAPRGATGSGAGGIGLGGVPGGARFDQDFEYSYYQRQMIARVQANWQQIPVRGETTVVIRFDIARDGTVSGAEVETSSGQPLLDRAALRAVVRAAPLPRLPDSYPRDRVGVHLLFTYSQTTNDDDFNGLSLASWGTEA